MRRWAALALLLGATGATLATIAVVVFQLADDGGALVAEAGRPSARRCRLTKLKLQTRLGARHSRLRSPLRREGPGLVLLGAAGGRRAARAPRRACAGPTQIDGGAHLPCCADPEWDFRKRPCGRPCGAALAARSMARARRVPPQRRWCPRPSVSSSCTCGTPWTCSWGLSAAAAPARCCASRAAPAATHAATQRAVAPLRLSRQRAPSWGCGARRPCFATCREPPRRARDRPRAAAASDSNAATAAAVARPRRLPFVAERPDESLALLAAAYGWDADRLLPLATAPRPATLSAADRATLRHVEPNDAVLHGTAEHALNAWVARASTSRADVAACVEVNQCVGCTR